MTTPLDDLRAAVKAADEAAQRNASCMCKRPDFCLHHRQKDRAWMIAGVIAEAYLRALDAEAAPVVGIRSCKRCGANKAPWQVYCGSKCAALARGRQGDR